LKSVALIVVDKDPVITGPLSVSPLLVAPIRSPLASSLLVKPVKPDRESGFRLRLPITGSKVEMIPAEIIFSRGIPHCIELEVTVLN
jgi:hypothetical protein